MPKKLLVNRVCNEFCSLLLSKPLVLLEIPRLKKVLEICTAQAAGCCSSSKERRMITVQNEAHKVLSSVSKENIIKIRESLLKDKKNSGINIIFDKINKNIII